MHKPTIHMKTYRKRWGRGLWLMEIRRKSVGMTWCKQKLSIFRLILHFDWYLRYICRLNKTKKMWNDLWGRRKMFFCYENSQHMLNTHTHISCQFNSDFLWSKKIYKSTENIIERIVGRRWRGGRAEIIHDDDIIQNTMFICTNLSIFTRSNSLTHSIYINTIELLWLLLLLFLSSIG